MTAILKSQGTPCRAHGRGCTCPESTIGAHKVLLRFRASSSCIIPSFFAKIHQYRQHVRLDIHSTFMFFSTVNFPVSNELIKSSVG
jgi:hypothetical protein